MKNYNYKFFIMLFKHPIARTANLARVKKNEPTGCIGDFRNFSPFSLKAYYCSAYHRGADCSD